MFVEAEGTPGCHATTHGRKLGIPDKVLAFHTLSTTLGIEMDWYYILSVHE